MKVRNGFVSNSSSSSFIIGTQFLTEDQILKLEKLYIEDCANDNIYDDNGANFNISKHYIHFTGRENYKRTSGFFEYLNSLNLSDDVLYRIES